MAELKERFVHEAGYEPNLVLLAVGSLASVNESACLELAHNGKATVPTRLLTPTSRGLALVLADGVEQVGPEFCFDFNYMQLVVDDCWLSFPVPWFREVFVDADLGYMLAPLEQYRAERIVYLKRKTRAVIYFIRILEASFRAELRRRGGLLDKRRDLAPRFEQIWANTLNAYRKILPDAPAHLEEMAHLCERLRADPAFDEFWTNYDKSGVPVQDEEYGEV